MYSAHSLTSNSPLGRGRGHTRDTPTLCVTDYRTQHSTLSVLVSFLVPACGSITLVSSSLSLCLSL